MKIILSEKIRTLCKAKNISLKELCYKINISQTGLQGILRNNTTSIDRLAKISEALNVPVTEFFNTEIEEKKQSNSEKVWIELMVASYEEFLTSKIDLLVAKKDDLLEQINLLEKKLINKKES